MEVHGASATWVMHDAWGAHGGPATNGLKGDPGEGGGNHLRFELR